MSESPKLFAQEKKPSDHGGGIAYCAAGIIEINDKKKAKLVFIDPFSGDYRQAWVSPRSLNITHVEPGTKEEAQWNVTHALIHSLMLKRLQEVNKENKDIFLENNPWDDCAVGHDGQPATHCPCKLGSGVLVREIAFHNVSGGTEIASFKNPATIQVLGRFFDYETGWRFCGRITSGETQGVSFMGAKPIDIPEYVLFGEHDLVGRR